MILGLIVLTVLSAILYRLGGMGQDGINEFPELPEFLFDTKARDIGCGLCTIGAFFVCGLHHNLLPWVETWHLVLACVVSVPTQLGALSTYWDFMFGYDNHWVHGFMCGVALFPLVIITGAWIGFAIRCVAVAVLMGAVSTLSGDDDIEELGSGASLVPTVALLLI